MSAILVVDDAMTTRMYYAQVLAQAGWQVQEAANGVEALEKVAAQPEGFDLYVVDVNMPKMDGLRFLRELRALPDVPQAPVVMVSTEAQAQDAQAGYAAGANLYCVKPLTPAQLTLTAALLLGDSHVAAETAAAGERP